MFFIKTKHFLLDLLFPHVCSGCGNLGEVLCGLCRKTLQWAPPTCFVCQKSVPETMKNNPGRTCRACRKHSHVSLFLSPFSYSRESSVREMVTALKFNRNKEAGAILGALAAEYCRYFSIRFPENALLVPLPLHPARKRVRGFNQAEVLAKSFFRESSSPCLSFEIGALVRKKNTKPQTALISDKRKENVLNAFDVLYPEKISGKTAILFDDVKTTGATLEDAARALKKAGAKEVWAIAIAH